MLKRMRSVATDLIGLKKKNKSTVNWGYFNPGKTYLDPQ